MASLHCFYAFPIPYVFDDGANRQKELTENIRERAEAPMTMNKIGTRRNETRRGRTMTDDEDDDDGR